jgi:hypothetical protein
MALDLVSILVMNDYCLVRAICWMEIALLRKGPINNMSIILYPHSIQTIQQIDQCA